MGLCSVKFKKTLLNVCAILVPVLSIGAAAMNKDPFSTQRRSQPSDRDGVCNLARCKYTGACMVPVCVGHTPACLCGNVCMLGLQVYVCLFCPHKCVSIWVHLAYAFSEMSVLSVFRKGFVIFA